VTEPDRLERNRSMLAQCHPEFARRVRCLIVQLEHDGYRPRIQEAWRSETRQKALVKAKKSTVLWGYHNATGVDGTPEALAVDLLDDDRPLVPPMKYLLKLAAHAKRVQCATGIAWGLTKGPRELLEAAIAEGRWSYVGARGWDPCHVEPVDVSIADARKGKRPV
jgi:hypothetical protein